VTDSKSHTPTSFCFRK